MNGWLSYRVEDLCEFTNGFAFKSSDYIEQSDTTVEVFRMGYIARGGGFKEDGSPVFVPAAYGRDLTKFYLKPHDVCIAMTDMKDRVAILANTAWIRDADRFVLNQRVGRIRVRNKDLLDPRFFYYYSNSRKHVEYLRSRANSGVQVNLTTASIKEAFLTIPPVVEQKAITRILGSLDDKIELNRRMNETLEEMARAIFKSWFVDFDPVRAKAEGRQPAFMDKGTAALFPDSFEDSELGRIPAGWSAAQFDTVATQRREIVKPEEMDDDLPYIGLKNMPRGSIALSEWGHGCDVDSAKSRFTQQDVLFGKLRPYFHKVGVPVIDGVASTDIIVMMAKSPALRAFVLFWASSHEMVAHATAASDGTRMPRAKWKDLAEYSIPSPPEALTNAFSSVAEPMLARINANVHESRTLAELRDLLLPKLLSGEIRVEAAVEKVKSATKRKAIPTNQLELSLP